jgi:hypothetical protein
VTKKNDQEDARERYTLTRIPLDRQGYTRQGSYYGVGPPLFAYANDYGEGDYIRARDRADAKAKIRVLLKNPRIKFTR